MAERIALRSLLNRINFLFNSNRTGSTKMQGLKTLYKTIHQRICALMLKLLSIMSVWPIRRKLQEINYLTVSYVVMNSVKPANVSYCLCVNKTFNSIQSLTNALGSSGKDIDPQGS